MDGRSWAWQRHPATLAPSEENVLELLDLFGVTLQPFSPPQVEVNMVAALLCTGKRDMNFSPTREAIPDIHDP